MLKNIKIENWKSHLTTELGFDEGPNVLVGIMGAGKTSVAEAMSFALFGTFPALQTKKITLDQLILSNPKKDSASVEMQFASGDKIYTVKREIRRGKGSSAEISADGNVIDVNPKNVNKVVADVLGMDYDLFSKAIYSEQNGIDYFLRIPKGQRMEHIDRMLKLDRYERAREGSVFLRNKTKSRISELLRVVADIEKDAPRDTLKKVEEEKRKLVEEQSSIQTKLAALASENEKMQKKLEDLEEKNSKYEEMKSELRSLEATLSEMDVNINQKRKKLEGSNLPSNITGLKIEQMEAETEAKEKKEEEGKLREEQARINTTIKMLKEKNIPELNKRNEERAAKENMLHGIKKQFPEIESSLPKAKKDVENLINELNSLEAQRNEIKKNMARLEVGKCPTCEQEVTPIMKKEIEKKRRDTLSILGSKISEMTKHREKMEARLKRMQMAFDEAALIESQLRDYDDIESKLREIEKTVIENNERGSTIMKRIGEVSLAAKKAEKLSRELSIKIEKTDNLLEEKELLDELEQKHKMKMIAKEQLIERINHLTEIMDGVNVKSMRDVLTQMKTDYASTESRADSIDTMIKDKESMQQELTKRVRDLDSYKKDIEVDERVMEILKKMESVLTITQQQLREEFIKSVNSIMSSLWSELYPYADFSEVRLGVEDDYILQMKRGEEWLSADGVVSGGERSLACLALRVAFSMAFMPKLRWLMLDEPTHNLDRNSVEKLSEVLRERSQLFAEQVFVITHDERLSEGLPSIKLERNKMSDGHTIARSAGI